MIERALENIERSPSSVDSLVELMDEIAAVGDATLNFRPGELDLEGLFATDAGPGYQLITLQINEDYSQVVSAGETIRAIRGAAEKVGLTEENGYRVQMTGSVPLVLRRNGNCA